MKANKEAKLYLSKVALSVVTELEGTLLGYWIQLKLNLFKVTGNCCYNSQYVKFSFERLHL